MVPKMKRLVAVLSLLVLLLPAWPVAAAGPCRFVLGFATLAAAVPGVGDCQQNQGYAPNGDALQHTTGGLLVWRKADNWTAFTDGYRTWLNGPQGVQQRLNTERFAWESDAAPAPAAAPVVDPEGHPAIFCGTKPQVKFADATFPGPLYECSYSNSQIVFASAQGPRLIDVVNGQGWSLDAAGKVRWPQYAPAAPPPVYVPPAPVQSSGVIESQIDGEFQGWDGETIFKLINGQIWQQSEYDYTYEYDYMPDVIIYGSSQCGSGARMRVAEMTETVCVKRLK